MRFMRYLVFKLNWLAMSARIYNPSIPSNQVSIAALSGVLLQVTLRTFQVAVATGAVFSVALKRAWSLLHADPVEG
jgi:hypothetical protein